MTSNLITDISTSKYNIYYDKPKNFAYSYYTITAYNADIDEPLHKFWFHIPKAKVIEKSNSHVILALSNNDVNTKLVKYIAELENILLQHTKNILSNDIQKIKNSFVLSDNFPPIIKLDNQNNFIAFDCNDNEIDNKKIKNGSLVSVIIELNNIMASTDEAWLTWNILQIKEMDNIDIKKSLFKGDILTPRQTVTNSGTIPPPPPISMPVNIPPKITPLKINKIDPINTPRPPITTSRFSISSDDILSQLTKLKKVTKEEKIITEIVPVIEPIDLKKVETKEPRKIDEWYANSKETELYSSIMNDNISDEYIQKIYELKDSILLRINKMNEKCALILKSN